MFWGKSFAPDTDIKDLTGKIILVTGGNTGLGKETCFQLAKHNPSHVYLAARTPSKGEAAVAEIKKAVPSAQISFLHLDLASFSSIASAAKTFTSQSKRLDILLNNAGIMATPSGATEEGYEIQFGTNHMGHALLTKLLLPTLLSTAKEPGSDVRIVNLTSEGHRLAPNGGCPLEKSKLEAETGPWGRYGHSKLSNILFTKQLAARYPDILSVAIHPGVVKTDLYIPNATSSMVLRYGMMVFSPFMKTTETGAYNQLWAATAPKADVTSGAYYTPVASLATPSAYGKDEKMAEALWKYTEKELSAKGY